MAGLLLFAAPAQPESLLRGPYLQQGTDTSIIVRWRADESTDSVVRYGIAPGALDQFASLAGPTSEHEVLLGGLLPDTRYYYSVGSSAGPIAGDDAEHFFRTSPAPASTRATRIWVLGDSGTGGASAAAVRDAFLGFTGERAADLLVLLGDNAYGNGTDAQYQAAVFDMYPQVLRQTPVWSTLGNHDGHSADSSTQSGPYYDIFSFPTQGQAGGLASGTEAYYSFDYANIHFVCLESYETDRSPGSPMLTWLADDLAATSQTWIVAFWHHPPYSKGSHDSDTESNLIEMREHALPVLESYGVDLVLSGHSHAYERSFLIDSHYGDSATLSAGNVIDGGDGREGSDGPYEKPDGAGSAHAGTVYTVAGSSGQAGGGALDHPVMLVSLNVLGSMVIDVDGNRLEARFVRSNGDIDDSFVIIKGPDETPPRLESAVALDATSVLVQFSEPVDPAAAAETSNYSLDTGEILSAAPQPGDRSVLLTTSPLLQGVAYQLSVSGISDLAGNPLAPGSQIEFTWLELRTLAFQNGVSPDLGYGGMRDTWIDQSAPSANHGASPELLADGDDGGGTDLSSLMAWDLAAIPAGSLVQSAELVIEVTNPSSSTYALYEVKRDWREDEATWAAYANGLSWELGGGSGAGDRGMTALARVSSGSGGQHRSTLNAAGVALVQAWVDGTLPNYGFILADASAPDGLDFHASEAIDPATRPGLIVRYALPPDNDGDGVPDHADNCSRIANPDQRDSNADGYGNRCDADLDNDGIINFVDLGLMKAVFFTSGDSDADLDGDGQVNFVDLGLMKQSFFGVPGPSGLQP